MIIEDAEGRKKPVLNKKETTIAQQKQDLIKAEFDNTTNTVRLIVVNPRKTAEGEYSIKLVKEGTDGKTQKT